MKKLKVLFFISPLFFEAFFFMELMAQKFFEPQNFLVVN